MAIITVMHFHEPGHQFGGWRNRDRGASLETDMTVYDRAVRIQGKDGRELQAWRVVVYRRGLGLSSMTVPAPSSAEAAERARRR